jgi:hypothetical protein
MKTMLIFAFAITTQLGARQLTQAVWVYPQQSGPGNPVSDAAARRTMVENSAANNVTDLYVSVYQSSYNSSGSLMYPDADIADLIHQAHRRRIKIWAAYGAPDWPSLGCAATGFPMLRMAEVNAYNAAHADAEFDGVVLDVEPPEPADSQKLLALYQCVRSSLPQRGGERLGLAVAIRFFWDAALYQHIIDMELDHVIVMGYRDRAGTACSGAAPNGIICLDEGQMAYADRAAENNMILVGVETSNCCEPGVSFFLDGAGVLYQQAALVAEHFRASRAFGGFAVHRYQDSYLGGIAGWPAVNNSR